MSIQLEVIPVHAMKAYVGVEVYIQQFLTSVLEGDEWFISLHGKMRR